MKSSRNKKDNNTTISAQQSPGRMLILPLVLLLIVTLSSILAIVLYSVVQVNQDTKLSSQDFVKAIIDDRLNQYAVLAKDYAYWDATIENAYLKQNSRWIDENLGEYLAETFKVTDLFIINEHNDAVLTIKQGQLDKTSYNTLDQTALTRLITEARKSAPTARAVSGILMIDKTPAIVGASILQPEDRPALAEPQPVLFLAKRLGKVQVQEIARQYRINKLQYQLEASSDTKTTSLKLVDTINNELGYLSWQPARLGSLMLEKIKYPLFILLTGLGFITFIVIRTALSTSKQLKDAYINMTHLANHDMLTGLANRRLFEELLEQTIHAAKRDNVSSAMLFLDLDGFKQVNDSYGHHEGDVLLIAIAERLKDSIREADTVARIGGDEFTILLRNTSSHDDIVKMVKKIQHYLEQPIQLSKNQVPVNASISASVGITLIPQDGIDANVLMTNADKALYKCKEQGRSTYRFYEDLNK